MPQLSRFATTRPRRYLVAVLATAAALGIRLLMDPVLGDTIPYAPFFLAVAFSALVAGRGPAIFSAILGALSASYFLLPPRYHLSAISGADNQLGFAVYLIVSALLIGIAEAERRARGRAERELAARNRAEAEESFQHRRFEITLASIGDGVIATDSEGCITFVNKVASALIEWAESDALGKPIEDVFVIRDEETGAPVENPATQAVRERRITGLADHKILVTKSGKRIPIADSGAPIIDSAGEFRGGVLIFRNVSERRARDAELRQLKRMVDLSQDPIIITDPNRRIVSWNLGATEVYGWEASEAIGKVAHILLHTPPADVEKKEQALQEHGRWEGELRHIHKDGRTILCESRQVLLEDADGKIEGMLEINRDITERKRMERKLLDSAKRESLAVLAGGVAHDFNNLLTGVIGNAHLLVNELPEGAAPWSYAKAITDSADRAAKLADQMLAYSGRGRFYIQPVHLSEHVRQNSTSLRSFIPKNVQFILKLGENVPLIEADPSQLEQLEVNLVINGVEAMGPQGGRITVTTGSQFVDESDRPTLLLSDDVKCGECAFLEVSDTGCGMDEKTVSRIFEPFYTTKFVGRGLGLAAVQGIVRGHKGAVQLTSRLGQGTTLRVLLPALTRPGWHDPSDG